MKELTEAQLLNQVRDIQLELERRKKERGNIKFESPVGTWEITTEGDVEGRSIRHIGTFTGHLGEILMGLGGTEMYALYVRSIPSILPVSKETRLPCIAPTSLLENASSGNLTKIQRSNLEKFFGPKFRVVSGDYGFKLERR